MNVLSRTPLGLISYLFAGGKPRTILTYHGIQKGHPHCVDPTMFFRHMEYLSRYCSILPLAEIVSSHNIFHQKPLVSITFDDAYRSVLDHALPVLLEFNFPATVYAPSRYLGLRNLWDEPSHLTMAIMTQGDLRNIYNSGLEVGSHTQNHLRLKNLASTSLNQEIFDSKKELEDIIGAPVRSFSYPYGGRNDFDKRAVNIVKKSGYASAVTTHFGRFNHLANRYKAPRVTICPEDTVSDLKAKLSGYYDWIGLKERCVHILRSAAN